MIDKQTSVAPDAVTLIVSVSSKTTLLPARSSSDDPAGIGAFVINSTSWLFSSLFPALLPVFVPNVTVDVT
jgi:hypothetical protein